MFTYATMVAPTRLSDWPWVEMRIDCRHCPRRGCYRLARLADRFGPEIELERLIAVLARDCPYWRSDPRPYEPHCGARFTDWDHKPEPKLGRSVAPDFSSRYQPMGATRTLTLADLPGPRVVIVCHPCHRRGDYRVAALIERFGAGMPLPTVLARLAVGCMSLAEATPRCQAIYERPPR